MNGVITLDHGNGGSKTGRLVREVFARRFGMNPPFTDSAIIEVDGSSLAFTTDSYVIDPIFFPGGNIGKLAVCGTVNDLAVSGAIPLFISASFIIEEGFPETELDRIAESMAREAEMAGVKIVTGDTKVVEKGKCDGIFITTSGTGLLKPGRVHIGRAERVSPGDKLIINGPLGNHSIAVLGARKQLGFRTPVVSDCASLNLMISRVLEVCTGIHFMRDLTRGGLAAVLNELAQIVKREIVISESAVPVDEPVRGLCEILGFDPLYLANEGKMLFVVSENECDKVMALLKQDPMGNGSSCIGEIAGDSGSLVLLDTLAGGRRILDMPSGVMLPRIC